MYNCTFLQIIQQRDRKIFLPQQATTEVLPVSPTPTKQKYFLARAAEQV
jgi:hypothetical protein